MFLRIWLWAFSQTFFFCTLLWMISYQPIERGSADLLPQNTTLWTAWCPRPSSASSWRPLAITPFSSLRMSAESGSSKERPSASLWRPKASVASWASSWSLRCLQGSFRIGSWGRLGPKVRLSLGFHAHPFLVAALPHTDCDTNRGRGAAVTLISSGWKLASACLPTTSLCSLADRSNFNSLEYWGDSFSFSFFF